MITAFFTQAMRAPNRQAAFRKMVGAHVAILAVAALGGVATGRVGAPLLGHLLLVAGIVEGAAVVGWRLTQLPRSQALEFLLVSPLRPGPVFLSEAAVGLARLALIQLAGLPVLVLLLFTGRIVPLDLVVLLLLPLLYGSLTGLGLTAWAYEPLRWRRAGECVALGLIVLYLAVGILAVDRLGGWLRRLPSDLGSTAFEGYRALHTHNPFAALQYWLSPGLDLRSALERLGMAGGLAAVLAVVCLVRAASRLRGHFQERHYRAIDSGRPDESGRIGDRPLSWWAVKRVMEYSGRLNVWLASGFGLIYASYVVAGDAWPSWLSRQVFGVVDQWGGVPTLATGLVLLAAVPAAFQYGLWDASAADRCRRLELLLLTDLDGRDYWWAAAAAAWRRGRAYCAVAGLLGLAGWYAGRLSAVQVTAAAGTAMVLWGSWFALGFRAFASGMRANGLGMVLTLGLPTATTILVKSGRPDLAALLPPGAVYEALHGSPSLTWALGPAFVGVLTLVAARRSVARCVNDLRTWYDRNSGRKDMD